MKKATLTLCFFLLLLLGIVQFISLARANPVPYPEEPNQELPTLKVESPNNGEIFEVNNIAVSFSVTIPNSWNHYWMFGFPIIGAYGVNVLLDGNLEYEGYESGSQDILTHNYSIVLDRLESGEHSVKILITARTFYQNPNPGSDYLEYIRNMSVIRNFAVNVYNQPSPSSAPTISPEPTPTQKIAEQEVILDVVITVAVIGVGLGLLFYSSKESNPKNLSN